MIIYSVFKCQFFFEFIFVFFDISHLSTSYKQLFLT